MVAVLKKHQITPPKTMGLHAKPPPRVPKHHFFAPLLAFVCTIAETPLHTQHIKGPMLEFISQHQELIIKIFCIAYLSISFVTFLLYGIDKYCATKRLWRIPEWVLLLLTWLFGSLGAVFGLFGLKHKTKHWYFLLCGFLAFLLHAVLFIWLLVL